MASTLLACVKVTSVLLLAVLLLNAVYLQPTALVHRDAYPPAEWKRKYGPWAVVAGASKGLGREWVVQCARRGLHVVAIARNEADLEVTKAAALKANKDAKIEIVTLDLSDSAKVSEYAQKLAAEKEVGLLIYNAAMGAPGLFIDQDFKFHKLTFDVNVYSMLGMVHAFARPMVQRKHGGIIIVSSLGGEAGNAMVSTYSGSKSLQTRFAEALWWELKHHNVDVLAPLLGPTTTDALQVMREDLRKERLVEQSPEEVVDETMHALGRGLPTVTTGWFGKLGWIFLRYVPVPMMVNLQNSQMSDVYKPIEELKKITVDLGMGGVKPKRT